MPAHRVFLGPAQRATTPRRDTSPASLLHALPLAASIALVALQGAPGIADDARTLVPGEPIVAGAPAAFAPRVQGAAPAAPAGGREMHGDGAFPIELVPRIPTIKERIPTTREFPANSGTNRLLDLGTADDQVALASDPRNPDHLYAAWRTFWSSQNAFEIAIVRSTDQGLTWGGGCVFTWWDGVGTYFNSREPSLAISGGTGANAGIIYLAMTTRDPFDANPATFDFVSVWTVSTANFGTCGAWIGREVLNPDARSSERPQVVVDNITPVYAYLIYQSNWDPPPGTVDRDWYVFRSINAGVSWPGYLTANGVEDDTNPSIAYSSNQTFYVAHERLIAPRRQAAMWRVSTVRGAPTGIAGYLVSDTIADAGEPRVTASHGTAGTGYAVTFYSYASAPRQLWYAPWNEGAAAPAYGAFASDTVDLRYPEATADLSLGRIHLVFNRQSATPGDLLYAYAPYNDPTTGWVGFFGVPDDGGDVMMGFNGRGAVASAVACGTTALPHIAWADERGIGVPPNVGFERWWTPYEFNTSPVALTYTVDGTPHTGLWNNVVAYGGSSHTIATTQPQVSGGLWYCWASWSPFGGPISTSFNAPCSYGLQTVTGNFAQTDYPDAVGNSLLCTKSTTNDLDWANASQATSYLVYKSNNPATVLSDPSPVPRSTSDFSHNVLGDGLTWYYKVATVNGCITRTTDYLQADFTANSCNGTNTITFTNATVGGVAPLGYLWTFGDGNTSTAVNPTHTYAGPPYQRTVTLTVTDADTPTPSSSNVSKVVRYGSLPGASFTYVKSDLTATFDGTASGGTGGIPSYSWTFGDGGTSTVEDPVHAYAAGGNYVVRLTVIDGGSGCSASSQQTVPMP